MLDGEEALHDALLAMGIDDLAANGANSGRNDEELEEGAAAAGTGDSETDRNVHSFQNAARETLRNLFGKPSPFRTVVDDSDSESESATAKETKGDTASEEEEDSSSDSEDEDDGLCYPTQVFFGTSAASQNGGHHELGALSATRPEQLVLSLDTRSRSIDIEYSFFAADAEEATIVAAISIPVDHARAEMRTSALPRGAPTQVMLVLQLEKRLVEGSFLAQEMQGENAFEQVSDWTVDQCASRADAIIILGRASDLVAFSALLAERFPESSANLRDHAAPSSSSASLADAGAYRSPRLEGGLADSDDEGDDGRGDEGTWATSRAYIEEIPDEEDDLAGTNAMADNAQEDKMPPLPDYASYEPLPVSEEDLLASLLEGGMRLGDKDADGSGGLADLELTEELLRALELPDDDEVNSLASDLILGDKGDDGTSTDIGAEEGFTDVFSSAEGSG